MSDDDMSSSDSGKKHNFKFAWWLGDKKRQTRDCPSQSTNSMRTDRLVIGPLAVSLTGREPLLTKAL